MGRSLLKFICLGKYNEVLSFDQEKNLAPLFIDIGFITNIIFKSRSKLGKKEEISLNQIKSLFYVVANYFLDLKCAAKLFRRFETFVGQNSCVGIKLYFINGSRIFL